VEFLVAQRFVDEGGDTGGENTRHQVLNHCYLDGL